jgi:hypothetical protein
VHSCSRPSPSIQSFSVAMYGKMPRERYDMARARALAVASGVVEAPREDGRFGSRGFVGGTGPRFVAGAGCEGGVENRLLTQVWMCASRTASPGGISIPQTGHSSSSFT